MLQITAFYDRLALNSALAIGGVEGSALGSVCGGAQKP